MGSEVAGRKTFKVSRGVLLVLLVLCTMAFSWGKKSSVEGKLVDWDNKPVAGVKITASQVQPIKGYEQFEAVTGADGSFALKGLFPSSAYVLKPWSDKWTTKTEAEVDSAPQGETAVLPQPMQIEMALAKNGGSQVLDLATGALRFQASAQGVIADILDGKTAPEERVVKRARLLGGNWVIADGQTKLEWVVGPDKDTNYAQAMQWVASCSVAGGGWRMPTRVELKTLYQQGVGESNMDPAFKTTGWWVWAEPRDSSSAGSVFYFIGGNEYGATRMTPSGVGRVFGVRSLPR